MADNGASKCFSLVRGRAMRVTRLDGCGQRVLGPDSQVTSDGFISIALTANTDEGETISVTNAAGNVCILDEPCPKFTGYGVEVEFCGVDPDLIQLMTGQPSVHDAMGAATGFRVNTAVDACDSGFAIEVWSNVPAAACDASGGAAYGYFLIPFVKGGVIGDFTIGNDAVNFTMTGANSKDGSGWGVGSDDVTRDENSIPGPLNEPIDANDHLHVELVTVAPPAPSCGATALGVPATGATAGTPGAYTPDNSYGPDDIADMSTVVADPTTAWTTGQHMVLRDGSLAYWNGTAWVAGAAP
jgi:hypothetical protein